MAVGDALNSPIGKSASTVFEGIGDGVSFGATKGARDALQWNAECSVDKNGSYDVGLGVGFVGGLLVPTDAAATVLARISKASRLTRPLVDNAKLQNIVSDLYRGVDNPDRTGLGTTADAIRNELRTGDMTGGKFHLTKGADYSNGLGKLLASGNLSAHDSLVAQSLLDDLQAAMKGH
jgi:hypothetical protein